MVRRLSDGSFTPTLQTIVEERLVEGKDFTVQIKIYNVGDLCVPARYDPAKPPRARAGEDRPR